MILPLDRALNTTSELITSSQNIHVRPCELLSVTAQWNKADGEPQWWM